MTRVTRRQLLGTVTTVPFIGGAGCTSKNPHSADVLVSGLESSDLYYNHRVQGTSDSGLLQNSRKDGFLLALYFESDDDYEPDDHRVFLMEGEEIVGEIENGGSLTRPAGTVRFGIPLYEPGARAEYRVISMDGPDIYDEFELVVQIREER